MRPARRLALAALLVPVAGGCSLFEPPETLAFETVFHSATAIAATESTSPHPGFVVLQSEADEAAFVEQYGLAGLLPEVDYRTEAVVGYGDGPYDEEGTLTVERVTFGRGVLRLELLSTGRRMRPGVAGRVPIHLVAVRRPAERIGGRREGAIHTLP